MSEPESKIPALVTINGHQPVVVSFLDGRPDETVNVRLTPLSKIGDYLVLVGEMNRFAEFLCDKPKGWSEALTDDSVYAIDSIGRELNDFRLGRYLERQATAVEKYLPMAKRVTALTNSQPN